MLGLQENRPSGTSSKTYSCVACSASFHSLASLLVHQASHASEITHQQLPPCVNCGSLFASKDLLENHHCMLLPPQATQELYICDCGEEFNGFATLEDHKKLHEQETQVNRLYLEGVPVELSAEQLNSETETDSKTDSSNPFSGQVSSNLSPSHSVEEPHVQSTDFPSNGDIKVSTDIPLPMQSGISHDQGEDGLGSSEPPSSQSVTEEQEMFCEKDGDVLQSSSLLNSSVHDSEKSHSFNNKSILKILASAYMSHRKPVQMKLEHSKRNMPPRKVAPRAPVETATSVTTSLESQPLVNQYQTKFNKEVSSSTGNFSKKTKIITVTQTLCPVVVLETRQKLFGRDNVEGRHQCGICRKVFQDIDTLIMHHAQHKKERVKFCLCCQQFVMSVNFASENHICSGAIGGNRQCFSFVGKMSLTHKMFYCSLCKHKFTRRHNFKKHSCQRRASLKCSAAIANQDNVKLADFREQCKTGMQDSTNNETSALHINIGVGTESNQPIKNEEQSKEISGEEKNPTGLKTEPLSLNLGDQLSSPEPSDPVFPSVSNSTPTESTNNVNSMEIPASLITMEAGNKVDKSVKLEEKQWTMPLDDAEIDVLIDGDEVGSDNEHSLEDITGMDCDDEEDVFIVEPPEDKMTPVLPSDFQVQVSDKGVRRFVCIGCQKSYSRRFTLNQHIKLCGARRLKQQNCLENTSLSFPGPNKRFPCPQCGKFFSRKDNMNMHRKKCHPPNTDSLVGTKPAECNTQAAAQENLFVLSPAPENQTIRQESSSNTSSRNWGIMSLPSVLPRRVTCECGASFTCPRLLFEHLQLHAQESYICPHCGESLKSWADFEAHQQMHVQSQSLADAQGGSQLHSQLYPKTAQSHVQTRLQPSPIYQASELKVEGQPPALLRPPHLNHRPFPETHVCQKCKKTFRLRKSLLRHLRLSCRGDSAGQKKQSCPRCGVTFQNPLTLKVHIQSNTCKPTFKPIRCPVCVRWFSCLDGLKKHLVSHSRQPVLPCQICGHNCSSPEALEEHKRNIHGVNTNVTSATEEQKQLLTVGAQNSSSSAFQCHICLRNYPKLQSLKDHLRKVHRPKDKQQPIMRPVELTHCGVFQCQICSRTYTNSISLRNHKRRVHRILSSNFQPSKGVEPNSTPNQFQCPICARTYPTVRSLQRHKKRVHHVYGGLELSKAIAQQAQHNLYKCQICHRSYPDIVSLKNHRRRVHRILGPVPEIPKVEPVDSFCENSGVSSGAQVFMQ